jgi:hypothetical protein
MRGHSVASLVLAIASLAAAGAARAESDPLKDAEVARIRYSFKVDGIALFDAHAQHAPRMGICAQSIFAGLKWCVSGTVEETSGEAAYVKTTGYNINADNRIVYAISSRRSYPLKRAEFDGIVQAIGERYGAGASVLAFKKATDDTGGVDSLIAVWGGIRLVQLTEAEYALVESGGSLKRGHLVDHRFNLVVSAKQRDPIYKIEGEAGYILHLMATSPDRADVIARTVYPPVFLPPPAKPSAEPGHPIVGETVRRSSVASSGERPAAPSDAKRIEAERGLAAERLLREEAERKAAEEKAARAEAERKAAAERRAFEEEKKRLEDALKAARERADRVSPPTDEARRAEEAERKTAAERREAEERARQLEEQRKALEERRRKDEAERKAAEERAKRAEAERAEAERKALEERRRKEEAERAEAERRAAEEKARAAAERKAAEEKARAEPKRPEAERKVAEERSPEERIAPEQKRKQEESERAAEQSRQRADEQGATERRAESERLARERAQRPESWRQRAATAAKDSGAIWSFGETVDRVADERTLRSQTVFGAQQQAGEKRLAIEVSFECTISGRDRRLVANARGFDRNSGVRVAFRSDGEGTFGVRTRFMLDDNVPQGGLLFRERQEDTASILELPMAIGNLSNNAPRGAIWLRHYMVMVEFPLVAGTVTATIAPQADNLRRVLEACAQ